MIGIVGHPVLPRWPKHVHNVGKTESFTKYAKLRKRVTGEAY